MRRAACGLMAFLVLGVLSACSPAAARAGRLFTAGDYAGAAKGYEDAIARAGGRGKALWLYRLAVSRAVPGGRAYDPAGALKAFERLREEFPGSTYSRRAELPMALLKALQSATRKSAGLRRELGAARDRLDASRQAGLDLEASRKKVSELTETVQRQEQTIKDLRKELEQLKSIDLNRAR